MSDLFRYRFLLVIFALCALNFAIFCVVAVTLGGDAINGKVVGSYFYLGSHGKFTDVSETIYTYSLWHARSLFLTHPLALVTGVLANKQKKTMRGWTLAPPPSVIG
jgi:hypothetical protein